MLDSDCLKPKYPSKFLTWWVLRHLWRDVTNDNEFVAHELNVGNDSGEHYGYVVEENLTSTHTFKRPYFALCPTNKLSHSNDLAAYAYTDVAGAGGRDGPFG